MSLKGHAAALDNLTHYARARVWEVPHKMLSPWHQRWLDEAYPIHIYPNDRHLEILISGDTIELKGPGPNGMRVTVDPRWLMIWAGHLSINEDDELLKREIKRLYELKGFRWEMCECHPIKMHDGEWVHFDECPKRKTE